MIGGKNEGPPTESGSERNSITELENAPNLREILKNQAAFEGTFKLGDFNEHGIVKTLVQGRAALVWWGTMTKDERTALESQVKEQTNGDDKGSGIDQYGHNWNVIMNAWVITGMNERFHAYATKHSDEEIMVNTGIEPKYDESFKGLLEKIKAHLVEDK